MVRRAIFWLHLIAGVCVGFVVLIMSITGTVLTYERQLIAWTTSHLRSAVPATGVAPMTLELLLEHASAARPGLVPAGITVNSEVDAPVTILAEPSPVFVDAYSGQELGERRGAALRTFLATMRSWHRWLGAEGENRAAARSITGWSNLLFLFIIVTGLYLWVPRTFRWLQVRQVVWFKRAYGTSKARDFNWHHVAGLWSLPMIVVMTLTGVLMSYPSLNARLQQAAGGAAQGGGPERGGPGGGERRPGGRGPGRPDMRGGSAESAPVAIDASLIDKAVAEAQSRDAEWNTISVELPRSAGGAVTASIADSRATLASRSQLSLDGKSGEVTRWQPASAPALAQRVRMWVRFGHTGEQWGIAGQTVAAVSCLGGVLLVWTGFALAIRRALSAMTRVRQPRRAVGAAVRSPA